jgi:hypothetical protein
MIQKAKNLVKKGAVTGEFKEIKVSPGLLSGSPPYTPASARLI